MAKGEEKHTICIGPEYISIGKAIISEDNSELRFKRTPSIPFKDKYHISMGNLGDVEKEVRKLYVPGQGVTDIEVEILYTDLLGNDYSYKIPPVYKATIKALQAEIAQLKLKNSRLLNKTYSVGNKDLARKEVNEDKEFIDGLRPQNQPFMNSRFMP